MTESAEQSETPETGTEVTIRSSGRRGTLRRYLGDGWYDVVFPDMGLMRPHGSFHLDNMTWVKQQNV